MVQFILCVFTMRIDVQLSKLFLNITHQDLENAIQYGTQQINMLSCVENMISCAKVHVKTGSPSHGQLIDFKPSQEGNLTSRNAEILIQGSHYIMSKYCFRYLYIIYYNIKNMQFINKKINYIYNDSISAMVLANLVVLKSWLK